MKQRPSSTRTDHGGQLGPNLEKRVDLYYEMNYLTSCWNMGPSKLNAKLSAESRLMSTSDVEPRLESRATMKFPRFIRPRPKSKCQ